MSTLIDIDSRGYGKIYKAVMRNRQLPLFSKAIYAYFCTYAGSGNQAYPKRDKIVRDLNINKDTYTKHLNNLIAGGYIAKERTASGNLYTIMQTVPSYDNTVQIDDEMTDILVMENIKVQGFGTVPKLVMLDMRLTAQAKAIYAYFASFTGAGTTAFPRRATIIRDLNLSTATYYSHFNSLIESGYITVERRKNNSKFDISLYHLPNEVKAVTVSNKWEQTTMSEKSAHGENTDNITDSKVLGEYSSQMSEELAHEELLKTSVAMSEKVISGKPVSEKLVCEKTGHANINNSSKTNNSFEKEQLYYHQGFEPDNKRPLPAFSLQDVKDIIGYEQLRCNVLAWADLKLSLGHFDTSEEKPRYIHRVCEILDETVKQAQDLLNASPKAQRMANILMSEAFISFFEEVLERWDEIRYAKGYTRAALKNMLDSKI